MVDNESEELEAAHLNFIIQHWTQAAALTWEHYQTVGRGAFVIFSKPGDPPPFFVSEPKALEIFGGWPSPEIAEMVTTYKPERQVVFCFIHVDGGVSGYCLAMAAGPTPPEAQWSGYASSNE